MENNQQRNVQKPPKKVSWAESIDNKPFLRKQNAQATKTYIIKRFTDNEHSLLRQELLAKYTPSEIIEILSIKKGEIFIWACANSDATALKLLEEFVPHGNLKKMIEDHNYSHFRIFFKHHYFYEEEYKKSDTSRQASLEILYSIYPSKFLEMIHHYEYVTPGTKLDLNAIVNNVQTSDHRHNTESKQNDNDAAKILNQKNSRQSGSRSFE
jgi:hypothetical protein